VVTNAISIILVPTYQGCSGNWLLKQSVVAVNIGVFNNQAVRPNDSRKYRNG